MSDYQQFGRKASLLLLTGPTQGNNPSAYMPGGEKGLDLSNLHFTFSTSQQDVESPNNCVIRVYNLSEDLVRQVRGEYSKVVLQAGYEAQYGVVFEGTIKQFRIGRENATDTYLDILAADGDIGYNFGFSNSTIAAQSTSAQRVGKVLDTLAEHGIGAGYLAPYTGGVLPRGKVLFGMPRALLREEARSRKQTWSIDNGKVNFLDLDGYKPGDVLVLSSLTGLIGHPESTTEGVRFRTLLNPRLELGCIVQINNALINKTVQQNPNAPPVAFNQYTGIQMFATTTDDGFYRLFVVEHAGDTRGQDWYSNCVALAVDSSSKKVKAYG